MKTFSMALVTLALAAFVGCGGSSTGTSERHAGGPGAASNTTEKGPLIGEGKNQFDLGKSLLATHMKQGETKEVKIDIKRGEGFDQDVTLKFSDLPKGVTIDPTSPKIKHGDKEAVFSVKVADDAALGDFKIPVTGHPTTGKDATTTFELKIDKKG